MLQVVKNHDFRVNMAAKFLDLISPSGTILQRIIGQIINRT